MTPKAREQLIARVYIAAFLDTDGSVSITRQELATGPNYYPSITFSGMYDQPLKYIYAYFPGPNITNSLSRKPQGGMGARMYYLTYNGAYCEPVARAVLPYLQVKRTQIKAVLKLMKITRRDRRAVQALRILEANFKGKTSKPSQTLLYVRDDLAKGGVYGPKS